MSWMKQWFSGRKKLITVPLVVILVLTFLPIAILLGVFLVIFYKVTHKIFRFIGLTVSGFLLILMTATYVWGLSHPLPAKTVSQAVTQTPSNQSVAVTTTPTAITPTDMTIVKRVIDGDTVELETGKRLRLIGMNTPEAGQCFYKQSSDHTRQLLEGKRIRLEKDISETDKYGRLLRYVWIDDTLINEQLVRQGFAQIDTYPPDVRYQKRFLAAQTQARSESVGLWGATCSTTSTTTKANTTTQTTCKYSCSGPDRDCGDFSTHAQAQAFFECCGFSATNDPMRLDRATGSGNGQACESLP